MIKLLTFDLDNTLWEIDPVIIEAEKAMRAWVAEHVPEAVAHLEMDQLKQTYKQILQEHPDVAHHPTNFRKKLLYRVFTNASLAHDHAHEMSEQAFAVFYRGRNQITLFHEAEGILETLSQRFPLIALTNGNANLEMIGIDRYFKAHFSSETEGKAKPHHAMFKRALEFMGIAANEAIHIGDNPKEDVEAAKALGYYTIWFNENGNQSSDLCSPTVEIQQLGELVDAVTAIAEQA
ncbi:MAG: HAD family hydrolase [Pseudomonadales bacterium]|nr:HAD family hydrolase [Pseudomonadales bacterium]RLU03572.1 MAG: HAD family hydrolase [Ketobacter sp.]